MAQIDSHVAGFYSPLKRDQGIVVLGSPVGTEEYEGRKIKERMDKVEELTERLAWLEDSHTELVLLRATLSLQKLIYVLRTVNPNPHSITRNSLGRIMATTITDRLWEEAKLKVGDGGEGLRSAKDHSIAAYTASVTGTWDLVTQLMGNRDRAGREEWEEERMEQELDEELMEKLCEALGRPRDEVTWEELQGMNQQAISVSIDARNSHLVMTRMEVEGDRRGLGRMRALQQPNAGAWLCVTQQSRRYFCVQTGRLSLAGGTSMKSSFEFF